jgi:hypothetical protein
MKHWWIPKTVGVRTQAPFVIIAEYETGEVKRLDMEKIIHSSQKLRPLAEHPELFCKAEVTIDDYHIGWKIDENTYVTFHSDHIYEHGEDETNKE